MVKHKRRIVFVLGTVRSGTTMLNLFIGNNNEKIMTLGEIANLFNPRLQLHFEKIKQLKTESKCWRIIIAEGPEKLYTNLSKYFPEIEVFVDSSKDPFWCKKQTSLNEGCFEIKDILIYKSFTSFKMSFAKRGLSEKNTRKVYKNQHKRIFSLIKGAFVVPYDDFVKPDNALKIDICKYLDILWSPNKLTVDISEIRYNFFGSPSFKSNESIIKIGEINNNPIKLIKAPKRIDEILNYLNSKAGHFSHFTDASYNIKYSRLILNVIWLWEKVRYKPVQFKFR